MCLEIVAYKRTFTEKNAVSAIPAGLKNVKHNITVSTDRKGRKFCYKLISDTSTVNRDLNDANFHINFKRVTD